MTRGNQVSGHLASVRGGFSLVEVLIALGLFALIGVAGYSMLSGVLQTQERTGGRLERLSEIQRALFVITTDLDQTASLPQGGRSELVLRKSNASGQSVLIRYERQGLEIVRTVSGGVSERRQTLLSNVASLDFSYYRKGEGWSDDAPILPGSDPESSLSSPPEMPERAVGPVTAADPVPGSFQPLPQGPDAVSAVAIEMELLGADGSPATLRRVVGIPEVRP